MKDHQRNTYSLSPLCLCVFCEEKHCEFNGMSHPFSRAQFPYIFTDSPSNLISESKLFAGNKDAF